MGKCISIEMRGEKDMKKSILKSLALVFMLVACLGMTVMANPSNEGEPVIPGGNGIIGYEADGEPIYGVITSVPAEYTDEVEALKGDVEAGYTVVDAKYVITDKNPSEFDYPVSICFSVTGVTADTDGYIMLLTDDGWVKVKTEMKNGQMCGYFDSLGTGVVAFVVNTESYNPTSPQTSASAAATVALTGLMAAAGAAGLKKKEFDK